MTTAAQVFSTLFLLGTLSTSLLGCIGSATVPLASAALDQRAKDFAPPLGQACFMWCTNQNTP